MQFAPVKSITNITSSIAEVRTYRLLQELLAVEFNESQNQNGIDNISSDRDEQTGRINATANLPCQVTLNQGFSVIEIINPYQYPENLSAAFFESAFAQWLGEQTPSLNPTESRYIEITPSFVSRTSPETGSYNYNISIKLSNLPTVKDTSGDGIIIRGAEYLQGTLNS